jgi:murein DD-endopeptidase MepM/ murein hydrolase activator NlpD
MIPRLALYFAAGVVLGWIARGGPTPQARAVTTTARPSASGDNRDTFDPVEELRRRHLQMPIDGATLATMKGGFAERRQEGAREHEAVDILAPRGTRVHAVDNGTVAKLFLSKAGGNTIYQFDPTGRFCYYYAHLERYAENIRDGVEIRQGDVIGFVGTSGNAPPGTPHLHFAVFQLTPERQWWNGRAIDPYLIFQG